MGILKNWLIKSLEELEFLAELCDEEGDDKETVEYIKSRIEEIRDAVNKSR